MSPRIKSLLALLTTNGYTATFQPSDEPQLVDHQITVVKNGFEVYVQVDWKTEKAIGVGRQTSDESIESIHFESEADLLDTVKRMITDAAKARLEELRAELEKECISYGEIFELQGLVEYIDKDDVQLLEAAGVPEFPEDAAK